MKSVNIFHNAHHEPHPIRVEFWSNDRLISTMHVDRIEQAAAMINDFMVPK